MMGDVHLSGTKVKSGRLSLLDKAMRNKIVKNKIKGNEGSFALRSIFSLIIKNN